MSKKLVGIIITIVVVAVLITVACLVFMINGIEVESASDTVLTSTDIDSIIEDSKIVNHSSVFGVDEEIATSNIEALHPYVKVISIERKFPSKVCINVSKRTAVFAYPIEDGSTYALLDREMKVLEIVSDLNEYKNQNKYVTVLSGASSTAVQTGTFLTLPWLSNILSVAEKLDNIHFINKRFATFIPEIKYVENGENSYYFLTTNTGVTFVLNNNTLSIGEHFSTQYSNYINVLTSSQKQSGYVVINESNECNYIANQTDLFAI